MYAKAPTGEGLMRRICSWLWIFAVTLYQHDGAIRIEAPTAPDSSPRSCLAQGASRRVPCHSEPGKKELSALGSFSHLGNFFYSGMHWPMRPGACPSSTYPQPINPLIR